MKLKKIIPTIVLFALLGAVIFYHEEISHFVVKKFIYRNHSVEAIQANEYALSKDYHFVQITDDFVAKDYQQLLNIFYTILDSGVDSFYFYCDDAYDSCLEDVDDLIPDGQKDSALSDLNNFVHPYNTYNTITIKSNNFGKVEVVIEKQYPTDKIEEVNEKVKEIKAKIEKDGMSTKDKIKAFHDYIINYARYDKDRAENMNHPDFKDSTTHTAYGLLETKMALCGGYSDLMAIYLDTLEIPNIRVSANNHVWNLVYLDDKWQHLDVTWDDPVTTTGEQILIHEHFLISYQELMKLDAVAHKFDENIYVEAK